MVELLLSNPYYLEIIFEWVPVQIEYSNTVDSEDEIIFL